MRGSPCSVCQERSFSATYFQAEMTFSLHWRLIYWLAFGKLFLSFHLGMLFEQQRSKQSPMFCYKDKSRASLQLHTHHLTKERPGMHIQENSNYQMGEPAPHLHTHSRVGSSAALFIAPHQSQPFWDYSWLTFLMQ